ncbi:MAG: hypothetical protein ACTSPQ_19160 [Candidatus Helarchaeota archaeon]
MDRYLIETDFLFGLRPSDKYYIKVKKMLELSKNKKIELKITNSAIFETRTVLYSQGKNSKEIYTILTLMKEKLNENNIKEEYVRFDDFILADYLRSKYPELTFFDSLHVAVSKNRNIPLCGNDSVLINLGFIIKNFNDF